jgi:hypothetical protein
MAEKAMYLDLDGLERYDQRIKEYIQQQKSPISGGDSSITVIQDDDGTKIKVNIDN